MTMSTIIFCHVTSLLSGSRVTRQPFLNKFHETVQLIYNDFVSRFFLTFHILRLHIFRLYKRSEILVILVAAGG